MFFSCDRTSKKQLLSANHDEDHDEAPDEWHQDLYNDPSWGAPRQMDDEEMRDHYPQQAYDDGLIESTRKWIAKRSKETAQRNRTFVISGEDWNEHLREDSGGGSNAPALCYRMKESLIATGPILDMLYNHKD